MEKVKEYLEAKGWSYKPSGTENLVIAVCPLCSDEKWHFSIHEKLGLWRCFKCEAAGNLYTLKRQLGDVVEPQQFSPIVEEPTAISPSRIAEFQRSLHPQSVGWSYLLGRGLQPETIEHFRLGLAVDAQGYWLVIPYSWQGEFVDVKYRSLPPAAKAFKKEPGPPPCMYNQDAIKGQDGVFITEGEVDCMTLWQLGYQNVASVPLGCSSFKPEYWDALADKRRIYLLFDNDVPGQRSAKQIAERLDPSRCYKVVFPGVKDVNEFICCGGTREQLDYLLTESRPYGAPTTYGVIQAIRELSVNLEQGPLIEGPTFPWSGVAELFGPMAAGEMSVVLGAAGVGKTSYTLQILTHVAKVCQLPALLMCLEMPIHRLAQLLVAQTTLFDRRAIQAEQVIEAMATLHGVPLYLARRPSAIDWDSVREVLLVAIRRFGIRVWAFDNIQFLCRSSDMVQAVGKASRNLKFLAEETGTHVIVVSHPRKSQEGTIPSMYDPVWSQAISADADSIHSVYRRPIIDSARAAQQPSYAGASATYEDRTVIHAAKTRYGGGGGTVLWLHGPSGQFLDGVQPQKSLGIQK